MSRAAWRAWLATHHATATEVTVEFARKDWKQPTVTYPEAVEEALCFGWIDGVRHTVDAHHYSNRFTPRRPGGNWSDVNKKKLLELETAGLMHAAGLAAIAAAKVDGSWTRSGAASAPDEIPVELAAALARFPKAKRNYTALAPGQQRLWRQWVSSAKQAATRERRAMRAVGKLEAGAKLPV